MTHTTSCVLIAIVFLLFLSVWSCQKRPNFGEESISFDTQEKSITFAGTIYPTRYQNHRDRNNGHHLIVWAGGSNAKKALINTDVHDKAILDALVKIGAEPGNNLTEATWMERTNESSVEPDKQTTGSAVQITVVWDGVSYPVDQLFKDHSLNQFDIRVGGHASLIPVWKSGCVTCLFSCPGGRTSNAAFTIRDQALNRMAFWPDVDLLPPDGTPVMVTMTLAR